MDLVTTPITADGTSAFKQFDGRPGVYEFGYSGVLDGASVTLLFKNPENSDEEKTTSFVLSASDASYKVLPVDGQLYAVETSGAGASTDFIPHLKFLKA